nr:unnamed protein product [Callosobruchus chinensis]
MKCSSKNVTKNSDGRQNSSPLDKETEEQDGENFDEPNIEGFEVQPGLNQVEEDIDDGAQSIHRNEQSKKGSRKRWSVIQKKLMVRHFASHIRTKKAARKAECEAFINGYKADFEGVVGESENICVQ